MISLCRAIIVNACFLELSEDDIIDPDSAVKAMEDIAATLQEATATEQDAFIATCYSEADRLLNDDPVRAKAADFIRNLPEYFGLR